MINMRNVGFAIAVLGLLAVVAAASADYTGMNITQDVKGTAAFGWLQISGVIAGILVLVLGAFIMLRSMNDIGAAWPWETTAMGAGNAERETLCPYCEAKVAADAVRCKECRRTFAAPKSVPGAKRADAKRPAPGLKKGRQTSV